MKTLDDLKEQIQEDFITYLDGLIEQAEMDIMCQIVVERINEFKKKNKIK
jgi:hypothetical protein